MLTREEYAANLNKKQPLSELEKKQLKETNQFIKNAHYYEKYTSNITQEIVHDYGREIAFLNYLKDTNPNSLTSDQQEAWQQGNEAFQTLSREEQRARADELALKLTQKKNTHAGYMNATIVIFVVLNLGFFLAALLLIAQ